MQAESQGKIFADKLVAFALRPNRIKHRDLWDMAWLSQQGIKPSMELMPKKLTDHRCTTEKFLELFQGRCEQLKSDANLPQEFRQEMQRFLPTELMQQTVSQTAF